MMIVAMYGNGLPKIGVERHIPLYIKKFSNLLWALPKKLSLNYYNDVKLFIKYFFKDNCDRHPDTNIFND